MGRNRTVYPSKSFVAGADRIVYGGRVSLAQARQRKARFSLLALDPVAHSSEEVQERKGADELICSAGRRLIEDEEKKRRKTSLDQLLGERNGTAVVHISRSGAWLLGAAQGEKRALAGDVCLEKQCSATHNRDGAVKGDPRQISAANRKGRLQGVGGRDFLRPRTKDKAASENWRRNKKEISPSLARATGCEHEDTRKECGAGER